MNSLSPRTLRGIFFIVVGICAFKAQAPLMQALAGSLFWHGLAQAGMSLLGLLGSSVGAYYLATRDKK